MRCIAPRAAPCRRSRFAPIKLIPIYQEPLCIQDPDGNAIEIIDYHGPGEADAPDYQERKRRQ